MNKMGIKVHELNPRITIIVTIKCSNHPIFLVYTLVLCFRPPSTPQNWLPFRIVGPSNFFCSLFVSRDNLNWCLCVGIWLRCNALPATTCIHTHTHIYKNQHEDHWLFWSKHYHQMEKAYGLTLRQAFSLFKGIEEL